jgi:hypothetical protein
VPSRCVDFVYVEEELFWTIGFDLRTVTCCDTEWSYPGAGLAERVLTPLAVDGASDRCGIW